MHSPFKAALKLPHSTAVKMRLYRSLYKPHGEIKSLRMRMKLLSSPPGLRAQLHHYALCSLTSLRGESVITDVIPIIRGVLNLLSYKPLIESLAKYPSEAVPLVYL